MIFSVGIASFADSSYQPSATRIRHRRQQHQQQQQQKQQPRTNAAGGRGIEEPAALLSPTKTRRLATSMLHVCTFMVVLGLSTAGLSSVVFAPSAGCLATSSFLAERHMGRIETLGLGQMITQAVYSNGNVPGPYVDAGASHGGQECAASHGHRNSTSALGEDKPVRDPATWPFWTLAAMAATVNSIGLGFVATALLPKAQADPCPKGG
ncbi:hypothetical protein [Mollivirus kamchatka]|nr:hypothetical protein [Mollivirus kamchatka]